MARGKRLPAPRCRAYPALGGEFDANPRSWNFPPKQKNVGISPLSAGGESMVRPKVRAWSEYKQMRNGMRTHRVYGGAPRDGANCELGDFNACRSADYHLRHLGLVSLGLLHGDRLGARHVDHKSNTRRRVAHRPSSAFAINRGD
jgi:hypothetical protein